MGGKGMEVVLHIFWPWCHTEMSLLYGDPCSINSKGGPPTVRYAYPNRNICHRVLKKWRRKQKSRSKHRDQFALNLGVQLASNVRGAWIQNQEPRSTGQIIANGSWAISFSFRNVPGPDVISRSCLCALSSWHCQVIQMAGEKSSQSTRMMSLARYPPPHCCSPMHYTPLDLSSNTVQYSHRQTLFLTQERLSVKSEITWNQFTSSCERSSEALAPILFEEAVSQGMMDKGYIWICGNDITTLRHSSFTPSFISK